MSASQYFLAVDVGTSRTAASTARVTSEGGLVTAPFGLGRSSDSAPSVVFVADGELLFGDAAERRGLAQPERLVREFKRRIGDDVPIVVGEQRFAPEELYARTVAWVVDAVTEREGARPSAICVTIPVTWGAHRSGLAAAALAREMSSPVELLTEPEAAARHYETTSPLDPGHAIAVYDLGGGTFDAVILRKADDATVRLVGEATGIADFGGADFDDIVLRHVIGAAGLSAAALTADATARVALGSLRRECVEAKEALSFDSEAVVPVLVGQTHTTVRLTRAEFEEMVDDGVERTMDVLGAALDAAGMTSADLDAILLTGGSSRIPRIAQLLSERFDRPIAIDADPKAIVALGAARELADRRAAAARRDDDSLAAGVLLLANDAAAAAAAAIAPAHGLRRRAAAPAHPAQGTPKRGWFGRVPVAAAIAGGTLVLAGGIVLAGATGLGSGIRPEAELPMALATDWLGFSLVNSSSPAQTTEIAAASPATPHSESARSLKAPSKHVKRPSDDTQAPVTRTSNATRTEDPARPSRMPDADTPRPTPANPPTTTSDDPPPANPPADPTPSDPPADPTPSGPPADPTPSDPPADPTPSDPPPDPTPSDPPADPTPSDPPPDPTPSDPPPADPEPSSPAPDPEPTTIPPPEPEPTP